MKCPNCGRELEGTKPHQHSCPQCDATASTPIDSTVDIPIAPPTADNSTSDAPIDGTVDIPVAPPAESRKAGTARGQINQTVEVDSTGQSTDQDSKARAAMSASAASDAQRVEKMWRQSISTDARPGMTIKRDTQATSTSASLLVKQRSMREPNEAACSLTDYELLDVLGEGGMGVVYTARQASIDRIVAVKMLKTGMKDDDGHRGKFFSEAVVTGDLEHPNIVPIYDMGANESGALFYSMKRVHGTPWNDVIAEKSLAENLRILMSVADAVAFAHVRGIVHRDLKPENVMLGDFGEVLVMDWGIAMATAAFGKSDSILQSASIGGTPAYMAPELASGQVDRIGPASDIYLLGAILFEILTGRPPHTGKNVMQCLVAAARNEIQPTDKSGELMDIARKAMATKVEDRYETVLAFQEAIRQYQAHSESIVLSSRAEEDLANSLRTRDYQDFSRALFAFQEAAALWEGNQRAWSGIVETQAAYATAALEKGDYDLGLSLLDPNQPPHSSLHHQLTAAQHERDSRALRLKRLKRIAVALAAISFAILAIGLVLIMQQKREADAQRLIAVQQREIAEDERKEADDQRSRAEQQTRIAEAERVRAEQQQRYAEQQRALAVQQRRKAEEASYVAQIGLAAERIASNAFLDAVRLLQVYEQPGMTQPRNWEWGHLRYLSQLAAHTLDAQGRVECVLYSPDARYVIAGTVDGKVRIWDAETYRELAVLTHGASVRAVAMTKDGAYLATGGAGLGDVKLWNLGPDVTQHVLARTLSGHRDAVLSLSFSPDQQRLLSSSQDETARVWDWENGTELGALRGHFGPVWSARYSPDGQRIVTAGDDGTVRVWSCSERALLTRFRGHQGAVYAAAFSADGKLIASGGADQRVLVWEPEKIEAFDFEALQRRLTRTLLDPTAASESELRGPPRFQALAGHSAEIRDIAFSSRCGDRRGTFVLSAGHDNSVRLWDLEAPEDHADRTLVFRGHGGWVRSAAFHPQGQFVLSGAYDSQVRVWNVETYEEDRLLRGQDSPIAGASFSANGWRAITAGSDGTAILWNLQNGRAIARLNESVPIEVRAEDPREKSHAPSMQTRRLTEGHEFLVTRAAFFPPGDPRLLTSAGDATVRMWHLTGGGQIRQFDGVGQRGTMALADDGKWILTGSDTTAALLWDANQESAPPEALTGHQFEITAVAISPGDELRQRRLFTGDANGHAKVWHWDAAQEAWRVSADLIGHLPGFAITAARFLPDGRTLLTACEDRTVMRWDTETGQRLTAGTLKHLGAVRGMDLASGGQQVVTLSLASQRDGESTTEGFQLTHWDLDSARELRRQFVGDETVTSAVFDQDASGVLVASMTADGRSVVKRWDLSGCEKMGLAPSGNGENPGKPAVAKVPVPVSSQPLRDGTYGPLWSDDRGRGSVWAAFPSPDGDQVLTVGGSYARLWDIDTGQAIQTFSPHGPLTHASFSPADTLAATTGVDGAVKIWSVAEQADDWGQVRLKIPQAHRKDDRAYPVNSAVFAPASAGGDHLLLTAGDDGSARIWDLQGPKPLQQNLFPHPAPVLHAIFSPDATLVATACADGAARIWHVATGEGQILGERTSHNLAVRCVAFSPDGKRLATGSDDNTIKIWDVPAQTQITLLTGHAASITSIVFSPDGRRIFSGSQDAMAKVWDADNGQQMLNLKRHAAAVTAIDISYDGRRLLTASSDGSAIIVSSINISPTITITEEPWIYHTPGKPVVVDPFASLDDPDTPHFDGGRLSVWLKVVEGEPVEDEQIAIQSGGADDGQIRVVDGKVLFDAGDGNDLVVIGHLASEDRHGKGLTVLLTEHATREAVQSLLRHISYTAGVRPTTERQIHFQLDDGQGAISHPAVRTLIAGIAPT
jgi:WD40 repeat protein/serine/threonine protein kinase